MEAERQWEEACLREEEWELCEEREETDPFTYNKSHGFTREGRVVWNFPFCPCCQETGKNTFHQLWECPHNESIPGTHLEYLQESRDGHLLTPSVWLRGLPPLHVDVPTLHETTCG